MKLLNVFLNIYTVALIAFGVGLIMQDSDMDSKSKLKGVLIFGPVLVTALMNLI